MIPGGETMLAYRQKIITDKILASGIGITDFEFKPVSNDEFNIYFKPNNAFYFRQTGKKSFNLIKINVYTMSPFINGEKKLDFDFEGFDKLVAKFEIWLTAIKENIDIGNPWDLFKGADWFYQEENFDNYEELFTSEEQDATHIKLDLLLKQVLELGMDNKKIEDDIKYLKEASNRVTKKDWLMMLSGVVISWGVATISAPENFQVIMGYVNSLTKSIKLLN
jgi:hypothetical protein